MYTARQFAINYLPTLKEQMSTEQKGIFRDYETEGSDSEEEEEAGPARTKQRHLERMHDIFYPQTWQEATLTCEKLWLLTECKSKEDFQNCDKLFETPEYLADEEVRQRLTHQIELLMKT
jgi:hypothetical protein